MNIIKPGQIVYILYNGMVNEGKVISWININNNFKIYLPLWDIHIFVVYDEIFKEESKAIHELKSNSRGINRLKESAIKKSAEISKRKWAERSYYFNAKTGFQKPVVCNSCGKSLNAFGECDCT